MHTPPSAPPISPVVDWFSRHGVKVLAALVIIEICFHAYAVTSARRREAEAASRAVPAADTLAR